MKKYIGKEFQLFPSDTYKKFGRLQEVLDEGFVFRIVESKCSTYKQGDMIFISKYQMNSIIFKKWE